MAERRLMELTLIEDAPEEMHRLAAKWNEALAAQLDYMNRHPPVSSAGFSPQERAVMDLPMLSFLSFIVPLMYDSDNPRRARRMWLKKMDERISLEQQRYGELRNSGHAR